MLDVEIAEGRVSYQESGHGLPLLLVHGFPLDHSQWSEQLEALSDHLRVIAIDLPGFGRSATNRKSVSMVSYADDCAAFLDAMGLTDGVVFVGLSMGGYIAWEFARRHRRHLAGLVLCNTRAARDIVEVARGRRMMAERVRNEGVGSVIDTMLPKLFARENVRAAQLEYESTREVMLATAPESFARAQLAMAERSDAQEWLAEIDVPSLVVAGNDDQITPANEMKQWAERMPNARFVEVPEAGHLSPLENPAVFNEALEKFVTRTVAEAQP